MSARRRVSRFADLPLSWKLLLPSVGLIVVLGIAGGFLIVRDLSARAYAQLDLELSRHSLEAQSIFRDRELSLIEAVNFASNIDGMAEAVRGGDTEAAARLLQSVAALKTNLEILTVADASGRGLVEFSRTEPGARPVRSGGRMWTEPFVAEASRSADGGKLAGFAGGERPYLTVAAPICSGIETCAPVGTAIAGLDAARVAADALGRLTSPVASEAGLTVFDRSGRTMTAAGTLAPGRPAAAAGADDSRVDERIGRTRAAILYSPFRIGEHRLGTLAVSVPVAPTEAAVRRTGLGLGLILLAAMIGIAIIGVVLSRLMVRRVRSLVETNRALGRGNLSARARVQSNDEIGELASHLNEMAEQLQAMYLTQESRVIERTEEIERLLRERTEFFASVSHELRTPLAVILGHADMLLDDAYRGNGRWRTDAGTALRESGAQLSQLIDDILELAEVEAGGLDVDSEPVDAGAFLHEMRATIVPLARAAGVRATFHATARDLPPVAADPRRLRQILLNLADNAIKYTPENGSVEIGAAAAGSMIEISVADSGVGIPADAGDRIFEPFFRVKGTQTQQGQASSGLGLAVARRLVEAHGGTIRYGPRPGGGTVFVVSLHPATAAQPRPAIGVDADA